MKNNFIVIDKDDNVAVALTDLCKGDIISVDSDTIELPGDIKAKHKFALKQFKPGDKLMMYGLVVGSVIQPIKKGELISISNVKHSSSQVTGKTKYTKWKSPDVSKWEDRFFMGYKRKDGQVGTRNIWLFFPLVFCENRNIEILKETFEKEFGITDDSKYNQLLRSLLSEEKNFETPQSAKKLKNIELKFITHPGGCGSTREDAKELSQLLAGYVNNPNVAGATILSLGCQNLQINMFKDSLKEINSDPDKPVLIYEHQQFGETDKMLNAAIKESFVEIMKADDVMRERAPLSKLSIGLECGGSDGFSGISANPVLGQVSDILVALGGSVILSEFPELCGVEQYIIDRCVHHKDAETFSDLMKLYEKNVIDAGSGFDMNPSPGNIKDGLVTDAMKSAGAAKKGGTSPVVSVLDYGQYLTKKGLTLLCTPGNDVESTTAMAGSGANLILFTTGLGTSTGNPITPVIKVSSNTELAIKMNDIIDFDAGEIIKGTKTTLEVADDLLELIIKIASGSVKSKSILNKQDDFIPWRRGVSL